MKHAREDYNRIQDPEGKIGEDEPVFLLRGKDAHAPATIRHWAYLVKPVDPKLAETIEEFADDMELWQDENGCKLPDTPEGLHYKG